MTDGDALDKLVARLRACEIVEWMDDCIAAADAITTLRARKEIVLTKGPVAIVDPEDYDDLIQFRWHARLVGRSALSSKSFYAERSFFHGHEDMHRRVIGPDCEGKLVDHINGNTLDNRRANLRIVTVSENQKNRRPKAGKQFKGIAIQYGKFAARIKSNGKTKCLGVYETAEDAARAYDAAAVLLHGEHARLNFPQEAP